MTVVVVAIVAAWIEPHRQQILKAWVVLLVRQKHLLLDPMAEMHQAVVLGFIPLPPLHHTGEKQEGEEKEGGEKTDG